MTRERLWLTLFVCVATVVLVGSCATTSAKDDDMIGESGLPRYFEEVPADTFFFAGGTEPVPGELVGSLLDKFEAIRTLGSEIDEVAGPGPGQRIDLGGGAQPGVVEGADSDESGSVDPGEWLLDQMGGEISSDGLEALGLSPSPHMAAYTVGFTPVLRIELDDRERFEEVLDDFEAEYELEGTQHEHEGHPYRRYDLDPDLQLAVRTSDDEAVITYIQEGVFDEFLPYFVGLEKPEESLADDNTFERIVDTHGFESYAAGFFDVERFVGYAGGTLEGAGITSRLVGAEYSSLTELRELEGCSEDYLRLARKTPRIVGGLRHYDEEALDAAIGVEFQEDLGARLADAVAGTPGHQTGFVQSSLLEMGIGFQTGALIDLLTDEAREIQSNPFECGELQDLNEGASQMVTGLAQVPPAVRELQGVNILLRNIVLEWRDDGVDRQELLIIPRAMAILRTDDPQGFMSLVSGVAPPAQQIDVKPDGEPVSLPMLNDIYRGIIDPMVLMTERGMGAAIGPRMSEPTRRVLDAEESATAPAVVSRLNLGDQAREMLDNLDELIDQADADQQERDLSDEEIESARRAVTWLRDFLPEGRWSATFAAELSPAGALLTYRDEGPPLEFDWEEQMSEETDEDFEALFRVLGLAQNSAQPAPTEPAPVEPKPEPELEKPPE